MPARRSQRLDEALLEQGLAADAREAEGLIRSGRVSLQGQRMDKPGSRVPLGAGLQVKGKPHPFVGRGGLKLEAALDAFGIRVQGLACLDIGASTGGFTDCLLQRGASHVWAVDTGHGQLDPALRVDPRVSVMERFNARDLALPLLGRRAQFLCMDVSFTSAARLLPALAGLLEPLSRAVVLVKPQFELPRRLVPPGGVVLDPALRRQALDKVALAASQAGFEALGSMDSPLAGAAGNLELLLNLQRRAINY
jgi:23S rRNA (cytidine1920-2'-O)/16S rRNA (cytidine1409-2'-O)-methyltransferase